jgi:hypothetical protein
MEDVSKKAPFPVRTRKIKKIAASLQSDQVRLEVVFRTQDLRRSSCSLIAEGNLGSGKAIACLLTSGTTLKSPKDNDWLAGYCPGQINYALARTNARVKTCQS